MNKYRITVIETHSTNPSLARIKAGEEFYKRIVDPVLEAHKDELGLSVNLIKEV